MSQQALEELARQSERDDTVIVQMVYRGRWVAFDMPYMQTRFLSIEEVARRYFSDALASIGVGETSQTVTSSSETTV